MGVARLALSMVLGIVLTLLVQLWDRRRQSPEQRARGWNIATWGCALYAFGPLSMLGWIFVTRRPWIRCGVAPLWTLPLVGAIALVDLAFGTWVMGEPADLAFRDVVDEAAFGYGGMAALLLVIELVIRIPRGLGIGGDQPPEGSSGLVA